MGILSNIEIPEPTPLFLKYDMLMTWANMDDIDFQLFPLPPQALKIASEDIIVMNDDEEVYTDEDLVICREDAFSRSFKQPFQTKVLPHIRNLKIIEEISPRQLEATIRNLAYDALHPEGYNSFVCVDTRVLHDQTHKSFRTHIYYEGCYIGTINFKYINYRTV